MDKKLTDLLKEQNYTDAKPIVIGKIQEKAAQALVQMRNEIAKNYKGNE